MLKIIRYGWVCLLFCTLSSAMAGSSLPAPQSSAQSLDQIVAIVENQIITQSDVNTAMARIKQQITAMNAQMPSNSQLQQIVLNQLIDQKLQLQIAKRNNITVSNDQINTAIEKIAAQNHLTVTQLEEKIKAQGLTMAKFRKDLGDQIIINEIQQQAVGHNITVNRADVLSLQQKWNMQQNNTQYQVLDILVPVNAPPHTQAWQTAKALANQIKQDLVKGININSLQQRFYQAQYNNLGWQKAADLPNLFLAQLAQMNPGQVSDPILADNGYHILKLLGKQGEMKAPSRADLEKLAYQQKYQAAVQKWLAQLRKSAYIKIMN